MDFQSRIAWVITIIAPLGIAILGFYFANPKDIDRYLIVAIEVFIALIIVLFIFFYHKISQVVLAMRYWFQKLYSDFVYSYIRVRLEYLKRDGSLVSYERDNHIIKLSPRRSKRILEMNVEVAGSVIKNSVSGYYTTYSFSSLSRVCFNCYFEQDNIVDKQYRSGHAFLTQNSFNNKNEYWIVSTERYAQKYLFNLIIPKQRKIKNVYILHQDRKKSGFNPNSILKTDTSSWRRKHDNGVVIRHRKKMSILSIVIVGLKPTDLYKICWELS